jgi:hypothetical protein
MMKLFEINILYCMFVYMSHMGKLCRRVHCWQVRIKSLKDQVSVTDHMYSCRFKIQLLIEKQKLIPILCPNGIRIHAALVSILYNVFFKVFITFFGIIF